MCVIIHNPSGQDLDEAIIKKSETVNPDGFGIAYLDGDREVRHTMNYEKAREFLSTGRPYVAHYRKTTVGETSVSQCHPFNIHDRFTPIFGKVKQSLGKAHWMFMNGTVSGFGCDRYSDTCHIAKWLGKIPQGSWENVLSMCEARFAIVNKKGEVLRTGTWFERDGVHYSKDNVLPYVNKNAGNKTYSGTKSFSSPPYSSGRSITTYSANTIDQRPEGKGWIWQSTTNNPRGGYWTRSQADAMSKDVETAKTAPSSPSNAGVWDYKGPGITLSNGGCTKIYTYGHFYECDSGRAQRPAGGGWQWMEGRYSTLGLGGVWLRPIVAGTPLPKCVAPTPSSTDGASTKANDADEESGEVSDDDDVDDTQVERRVESICRRHGALTLTQNLTDLDPAFSCLLLETFDGSGAPGLIDYLNFSGYISDDGIDRLTATEYGEDNELCNPFERGFDDATADMGYEFEEPEEVDDGVVYDLPYNWRDKAASNMTTKHPWEGLRKVAVYGTLKSGHGNHRLLDEDCVTFVGSGNTVDKYSMKPSQWVPHVVNDGHKNAKQIEVEVYTLGSGKNGNRVLNNLDMLEGHPHNYERKVIDVDINGKKHKVWLYFCDHFQLGNSEERVSCFPHVATRTTSPPQRRKVTVEEGLKHAPTRMGPDTDVGGVATTTGKDTPVKKPRRGGSYKKVTRPKYRQSRHNSNVAINKQIQEELTELEYE